MHVSCFISWLLHSALFMLAPSNYSLIHPPKHGILCKWGLCCWCNGITSEQTLTGDDKHLNTTTVLWLPHCICTAAMRSDAGSNNLPAGGNKQSKLKTLWEDRNSYVSLDRMFGLPHNVHTHTQTHNDMILRLTIGTQGLLNQMACTIKLLVFGALPLAL